MITGQTERKQTSVPYDKDTDYRALIDEAAAKGDFASAALYEQQRNEKIVQEGLQYAQTQDYAAYLPKDSEAPAQTGGSAAQFSSAYDEQLRALYQQISERPAFQYDLNTDALYQMYCDQYAAKGQLAMRDTMAQAAALTGGYGSTYAQAVGQQRYNAYLQNLSALVPQLYQQAANRYDAQTDLLLKQYSMLDALRDREYTQWKDSNKREKQAQAEAYSRQKTSYARLVKLISSAGYQPNAQELASAGMTQAQAQAYLAAYQQKQSDSKSGGGKSGGGKSGGGKSNQSDSKQAGTGSERQNEIVALIMQEAERNGDAAALELLNMNRAYLPAELYEELLQRYSTASKGGGSGKMTQMTK